MARKENKQRRDEPAIQPEYQDFVSSKITDGQKKTPDHDGQTLIEKTTDAEEKYRTGLEEEVEERNAELKEKSHFISRVTGVMPDLVSVIELRTMEATYINPQVLQEMGFENLDKLSPEQRSKIIHPDDLPVLQDYFDKFASASDDTVINVEYRAKIKTGEWRWFHARGKVFSRDDQRRPTHCINVVENITRRKNAEKQIAEQGKELAELHSELLNRYRELESLNRELKNFNSITANNYSETLRHVYINLETIVTTDARYLSNTSRANLRRAQSSIQKIKLLTNDINNYLQLYDVGFNKTLINPNEIIKNVLSGNLKGKIEETKATFQITKLPAFVADPLLFSRLMTELIDNSIKFRKLVADPVVKINCTRADELNSIPRAIKDTPYFIVSVWDNGTGFKEEDADKIFDLFIQLQEHGKHKGSGIGLAICKKIMEMHNGFISAEGESGHSAFFHCYFPA